MEDKIINAIQIVSGYYEYENDDELNLVDILTEELNKGFFLSCKTIELMIEKGAIVNVDTLAYYATNWRFDIALMLCNYCEPDESVLKATMGSNNRQQSMTKYEAKLLLEHRLELINRILATGLIVTHEHIRSSLKCGADIAKAVLDKYENQRITTKSPMK